MAGPDPGRGTRREATKRARRHGRRLAWTAIASLVLLLSACGNEELPQNSLDPAGPIAREIDGLWWLVFWIAAVIFVIVQAALIVSVVRFRRRKDEADRPVKQIHGNTRLEVLWTIIPAVLLAGIAVPTVSTLLDIRSEPEGPDVLEVNVVGHQWWWEFDYPGLGINTANELHIPAETDVYLTMTSADVIHSFWVPRIAGKRDAVPGRFTNLTLHADAPGEDGELFLGQCAEFCGLAHADMRIRVFVHDDAGFDAWVASQQQPAAVPEEGIAAEGWDLYQRVCTACHVVRTEGFDEAAIPTLPAGFRLAPDLTHYASRTTFGGASFDNTTEHLAAWLANPSDLKPMDPDRNDIANGRILGMPNFGLDDGEINALVALLQGLE